MRVPSAWSHPEFRKVWSAFTISRVGSEITVLALPLTAVLLLGAGATETGLLVAARTAPVILPGPFVGVWVDRRTRRPIMVAANIGSAIAIGSIPVAAALGALTMAQLYIVSFLAGHLQHGHRHGAHGAHASARGA
jgi:MFS family permease